MVTDSAIVSLLDPDEYPSRLRQGSTLDLKVTHFHVHEGAHLAASNSRQHALHSTTPGNDARIRRGGSCSRPYIRTRRRHVDLLHGAPVSPRGPKIGADGGRGNTNALLVVQRTGGLDTEGERSSPCPARGFLPSR
mmetsp:Transcript_2176/g.5776  ORF Transcript_2176/g.5776 Transcript_2176/m.5776 type:complete len:136 (+) Transcript_2176:661-1068(+)